MTTSYDLISVAGTAIGEGDIIFIYMAEGALLGQTEAAFGEIHTNNPFPQVARSYKLTIPVPKNTHLEGQFEVYDAVSDKVLSSPTVKIADAVGDKGLTGDKGVQPVPRQ